MISNGRLYSKLTNIFSIALLVIIVQGCVSVSSSEKLPDGPLLPGTELIKNPLLSMDTDGQIPEWLVHNAWSPDEISKLEGTNSMRTSGKFNALRQYVSVVGGQLYELSITARREESGRARVVLKSSGDTSIASIDFTPTNDWSVFKEEILIPEAVTEVEIAIMNVTAQTLWIDQVGFKSL